MESILNSVKKAIGIVEEYTEFDVDLIMHINSVFLILNQLGVGPEEPFTIIDSKETWDDFFGENEKVAMAKTYMYMKVKMIFDPPNSSAMSAMEANIAEMEWRLNIQVDPKKEN